jgi:hypothetical protein
MLIALIDILAHPWLSHRLDRRRRRRVLTVEYLWTHTPRAPWSLIRCASVRLLPPLEAATLFGTSASPMQTFHRHPLFLKP